MSEVVFEVGEPGAPRLDGDDAEETESSRAAPDVGAQVAVLAWTPEEVSAAIQQYWNLGCLWFGPSWKGEARELEQVSILLAPYFDIWFPKGSGGDPGLVVVVLACLGTGITMALARGPAIAQHWRRPWFAQRIEALMAAQAAQGASEPAATGPAAQQPPPPAAEGPAHPGGSYKLPRDLAAVVTPGTDESLASHGM